MKILLNIGIILMSIMFASIANAGNAPKNVQVLEASDSSIYFDWDDTESIIGYYVYYGTQSASGSSYEIEGIDLIDESMFILEGLTPETSYFVAFTSVDEFGTESEYSQEIEYTTLAAGEAPKVVSFKVSDVRIIDETSIEIMFSTDLETGASATREFIIQDKNTGVEIPVDISDILDGEPKSIVAVLGSSLSTSTEYEVTVLDISDARGNTIESGIDAFINFTTPGDFTPEFNSAGSEESEVIIPIEDPTPVIEEPQTIAEPELIEPDTQSTVGNNAGTTISTSENTLSTAQENEKLPSTGPEHWILVFIALLLAGGVFYMSTRKES